MIRHSLLTVLVGLVGLPLGVRGQGWEEFEGEFSFAGITYPSVVGDFRVVQAMRWADVEAGVGLNYALPEVGGEFSVFVYPVRRKLERELAMGIGGMIGYAEQNGGRLSVDSTRSVEMAGVDGELVVGSFTGHGQATRTLLYVFEQGGTVFKYRFTYDPAIRDRLEPRLTEFVRVTLTSIADPWR